MAEFNLRTGTLMETSTVRGAVLYTVCEPFLTVCEPRCLLSFIWCFTRLLLSLLPGFPAPLELTPGSVGP